MQKSHRRLRKLALLDYSLENGKIDLSHRVHQSVFIVNLSLSLSFSLLNKAQKYYFLKFVDLILSLKFYLILILIEIIHMAGHISEDSL